MKNLLSIYLIIFTLSASSQVTVKGIIETNTTPLLFLNENIGGVYHSIDSVFLTKTGEFSFTRDFTTGYYSIGLNDTNWIQFIIQPPERTIQFYFSSSHLQADKQVIKSEHNIALYSFINMRQRVKKELKQLYIAGSYEKEGSHQFQVLQDIEDSIKHTYNEYLIQHYQEEPNSFLWRTAISDADTKNNFFRYTFFDDPELIRSGVLTHKVTEYLQFQTNYTEDGFEKSIDYILNRASVNQTVYDFILNYLLELFNEVGPDVILDYLVDEYVIADGCTNLKTSDIIAAKLQAYKQLKPGQVAPNVSMFKVDGYMSNLKDLCSLSKINILFFGSSECHFCQDAIPQIIAYSYHYTPQELNIIFISLDTEVEKWKKESANFPDNWISLSELKGWKSVSTALFQVHKTPGFYLLDQNFQIISKPKNTDQLLKELDFFLK